MQIHGRSDGAISALAERLRDSNVSLRWGGSQVEGAINGSVHLLDAREQLVAFQKAGIPCPEFTFDRSVAETWLRTGSLVFGRKFNHTQGFDIICAGGNRLKDKPKASARWKTRDFWTKYVPSISEWRFHILNGNSIARGKKVFITPNGYGAMDNTANVPVIRSRRLGWHMQHDIDPPKGARTLAKAAVAAVGYDLGAVDMLEVTPGKFLVLEVNSRPAIRDPYTIERYALALR